VPAINTGVNWGVHEMKIIKQFLRNESGATAIEYGLAAVLISTVAIVGMGDAGQGVTEIYTEVEGAVDGATADP